LFFKIGLGFPFLTIAEEHILVRFIKTFWIVIVIPLFTGLLMYFYPLSEGKNLGSKIDQELPFVSIHMSAIATSGIEPLSIFKIVLKSKEYRYTNIEFRKLMNLVNFHGLDLITAMKKTAQASPSPKLKELLNGFATTMSSGGDLHTFLSKHAESLLFDYRLGREKYTKTSETFMDIYISIAIAAPMILLMLFVIMGSTGTLTSFMGLSTEVLSFLIMLIISFLNIFFLIFLKVKQPVI
jgi:flagellar protein FlaJ